MFSSSEKPAEDYIDIKASLGKLLIVRPLEYRTDFKTTFSPDGTDVVFCDIACVDDLDPNTGAPGRVFRSQAILQGHLKGTFKRCLGQTIIGMLHQGTDRSKGNLPYLWHDLSQDAGAVARGGAWLQANQSFLVQIATSAPVSAAPSYTPPPTPPVLAPLTPAQYAAPVSPAPQMSSLDQMRAYQSGETPPPF